MTKDLLGDIAARLILGSAIIISSSITARALEAVDAIGCWIGEQRDGTATYRLESCEAGICGKAIKAAAGGMRPTEGDLKSKANQNFFSGKKSGNASWSGKMYIFRFKTTSTVQVDVKSENELSVGNSLATRTWTRVKCPSD